MAVTNLEVAQNAKLKNIRFLQEELGISDDDFEPYGKYIGKVRLEILEKLKDKPDGKLILVTAMTPTKSGEGKTLTTVGLGQALKKLGKKSIIALREPSLGPVFGMKGGATGGGYSQVLPMEEINLHFTGDLHAISTAHNLLAAMLDNSITHGDELDIDVSNTNLPRTVDMNDRALRKIIVGLGGKANGIPRESGYVITAASEVMAILALARSRRDLKERLGEILVGFSMDGKPIHAKDLGAQNAMCAILKNAIMPNLAQTIEHTPALIHAGPFANIAHGTNSVIADKIALKLADYVVTECGFGADLGAEKFFDIVCRQSGMYPSTVVIVATCRAIAMHGGAQKQEDGRENDFAMFRKGLSNLRRHIENIKKFGTSVVVAINEFPYDTPEEVAIIKELCAEEGVECAEHNAYLKGGAGAMELAEKVVELADANPRPTPKFLYDLDLSIEEKVEKITKEYYGGDGVYFERQAMKKIKKFEKLGYGKLPICIAKTQYSFSDQANLLGAPSGWNLTVSDATISAGAGFIVIICGDIMLMPGLPKVPAAASIDIDDDGVISGLF